MQNIYSQTDGITILNIEEALKIPGENMQDKIPGFREKEIKGSYFSWIYCISRLRILTEKKELYGNLAKIAGLKYEEGEINIALRALSESEYLKTEVHCVAARNELLMAENDLKRALSIKNDIMPENDSLVRYELQADIADISAGDSITGDSRESYTMLKNFENLKLQLKMYDEQIIFYLKVLTNADQTKAAAKARYENEDIEYTDYLNIVDDALDFKLEYLKAMNNYNQTAIKIEAYLK